MFNAIKAILGNTRKSEIAQNAAWNVLGSMSVTLLSPIITIVVARLLSPNDYGAFGVAVAVVSFIQIGRDFGMTQAVIVSKKNDDFRNLQFTVQLIWGGILYLLLLIGAAPLAAFYHLAELGFVLPLLGITILLGAFIDPMQAANLKAQNYRFLFFRQITPAIMRWAVVIALAYNGAGIYALVASSLSGVVADAVFLFWRAEWKPRLHFDRHQFQEFLKLGKHQVFQEFCGFLVLKADALIVGKNLGIASLGVYQMGSNLANFLPNAVVPQIAQVVFTDLAKRKGDIAYLTRRYYYFVYLVGVSSLGFSVTLYLLAKPLVLFLLGQKWNDSVIVMQAFSLIVPLIPLSLLNSQISKIYNFNHIYSYFATGRGLITVGLLLIASFYSLHMVLLAWVISGLLGASINNWFFFRYQAMVRASGKFLFLYCACCLWVVLGLAGIMVS